MFSNFVFLKWLSISFAPFNNLLKLSKPTERLIEIPTALQRENLPPTQFHIGNILFSSIPNEVTFSIFVDTAIKCFVTSPATAPESKNQVLIVFALERVSWVVKVLETIINRVDSGFKFFKTSLT